MLIAAAIAGWAFCAVLAWGLTLGSFTARYPYARHGNIATWMAGAGPIGLIVALFHPPYSFLLRPLSREERWREHRREFPYLSRAYFDEHDNL